MRVNEIFYSVQGEGRHAGKAAVFVRFSGCNLKCPFCDTDFSSSREMTEQEVINEIDRIHGNCDFVVLTGGEPTIQITDSFIDLLHKKYYYVAVETNGAFVDAQDFTIDWVTVSPKDYYVDKAHIKTLFADEVKLVMDDKIPESVFEWAENEIDAEYYYVQPCDTKDEERNKRIFERVVEFVKNNPQWTISLQTQKIINVR